MAEVQSIVCESTATKGEQVLVVIKDRSGMYTYDRIRLPEGANFEIRLQKPATQAQGGRY